MINAIGVFIGKNDINQYKIIAKKLAETHQTRVLADGGVLPSLSNLQNFIYELLKAKGSKEITDILLTADPHITGYKLGATSTQCSKIYSLNQNTDLNQNTSAAQPLLLKWDKAIGNYWWGSGVDGNGITTPHTVTNTPTGSFKVRIKFKCDSITDQKILLSKGSSISPNSTGQTGSFVVFRQTNFIGISLIGDNKINYTANNLQYLTIGVTYVIDIYVDFTARNVRFYLDNVLGGTYSMLSGLTAMNVEPTIPYIVGSRNGYSRAFDGSILEASITLLDGSSPYISFKANDFSKSYSQLSQLSSTGEIWTYNYSSLTTGYKSQLVYRNTIKTDGVDDYMQTANYNFNQPFTNYNLVRIINFLGTSVIVDGKLLNENKLYLAGAANIRINSGIELGSVTPVMKVFNVLSNVRNTITSKLQLNKDTEISGNAGVNNVTGITLGCSGGIANFSNTEYGLQLIFSGIHDKTKRDKIVDVLNKYSDSFFFDVIGVLDVTPLDEFILS